MPASARLDSAVEPMPACPVDPVRLISTRAARLQRACAGAAGRIVGGCPGRRPFSNGGNAMHITKMRAGSFVRASVVAASLLVGSALSSAALADPVTLTWGMWAGSDAEVSAWRHVADMVTAKYPDIKITLQTASWPDYWTKLPTLAASNQLPDIVSLQSLRTPGFASLLTPLDDLAKRDKFDLTAFDKSIIGGLSSDGHVVALPYDFGPLITYYNADWFKKAGITPPAPGWTVDDMKKDAK